MSFNETSKDEIAKWYESNTSHCLELIPINRFKEIHGCCKKYQSLIPKQNYNKVSRNFGIQPIMGITHCFFKWT